MGPLKLPEGDLGQRIAAGDRKALEALYDSLAPIVYGLARSILRNPHDAEEVVTDTFVQVWRTAGAFDASRGSIEAWVIAICRSRALDRLRSARRRMKLHDREIHQIAERTTAEHAPDPSDAALAPVEMAGGVTAALEALPPEQRRAIELAYLGGLTQSEISRRLEIPLGTVKTRIRTGMQTLRDQLARGAAPGGREAS
jgi:RNA polymerase sigma-70 factor (ECF subfamily)